MIFHLTVNTRRLHNKHGIIQHNTDTFDIICKTPQRIMDAGF